MLHQFLFPWLLWRLPVALPPKEASAATDLDHRFSQLATRWKHERGPHSSSARLTEHPAYQAIIAMGVDAVPLIFRELEREPDHWFRALAALTGADPVPLESRGKIREMADVWLRWGRAAGYKW
ncbi:MAG: hypothetical protein L0Y71_07090 [Gemmataceae bacterium]|nr:hypothetical protein [Gemmataceae bacterium]